MSDDSTAHIVLALEERRRQAMLQADVETLGHLYDDGLVYLHSTGVRDSKASYLEKLGSGRLRYESLTLSEQTVVRLHNVALAGGRMDATVRRADGPGTVTSRYTAVWLQAGGAWRLLAVHAEPWPST